jgi:hypothetical protein
MLLSWHQAALHPGYANNNGHPMQGGLHPLGTLFFRHRQDLLHMARTSYRFCHEMTPTKVIAPVS